MAKVPWLPIDTLPVMEPVPLRVCAFDPPRVNETALTSKVVFAPRMIWDELEIDSAESITSVPALT